MFSGKRDSGQTIVIIAVAMFVLVAMAALIIDGGNAYLNRRNAQTAADAAALAGAYERCVNKGSNLEIEEAIIQYAVDENKASAVESWMINADGEIEVVVNLVNQTFFAKVFGQDTTTVKARAAAGCFPPGAADSVLPIAWSCRPPLPDMPSDSEDCEWKSIPWRTLEEIMTTNNIVGETGTILYDSGGTTAASYLGGPASGDLSLYIIMDTISTADEVPCQPDGPVDCDLDDDGRMDILGAGNRSWILLSEEDNKGQLVDVINGDSALTIDLPIWYPGREGADTAAYFAVRDVVEGHPALIPVFEAICSPTEDPLADPLCAHLVGPDDDRVMINSAASGTYFRVVAFAEFFVTCVSSVPGETCPGKELALATYQDTEFEGVIANQTKSIEGYFVDGWVSSNSTVGSGNVTIDLGVYVISLTE